MNINVGPPTRPTRKLLFGLKLWQPAINRRERVALICGRPSERDLLSSSPGLSGCTRPLAECKQLKFAELNVHSLGNKYSAVRDIILDNELDILVVCESWHVSSDDILLRRSTPPGYCTIDEARPDPNGGTSATRYAIGGGVVVYCREQFGAKKMAVIPRQESFEHVCTSLATPSGPVIVIALYRPGSAPLDQLFFREFTTLLEVVATYNSEIIISGDINVHLEDPDDRHGKQFVDLIHSFGFNQHVNSPTHQLGGLLDVIITRSDSGVENMTVDPPTISDHGLISCLLPFLTPSRVVFNTRSIRSWKRLDRIVFREVLSSGPLCRDDAYYATMSIEQLVNLYDSTLRDALDALLPIRTVRTRFQPSAPWFDDECRAIKRRVRMLERRYRRTGDVVDRTTWIDAARSKNKRFKERENLYWEATITSNSGNPRKLWRSLSSLLGDPSASQPKVLPPFSPSDYLRFMEGKLDSVRTATAGAHAPVFGTTDCRFNSFEPCTEDDLRTIIEGSPSKSCDLDPVPTFLVKDHLDILLPFITRLCNASIRDACLPESQKKAIITPVIKKVGADVSDVKNYRPISGLTFISKLIEKVVARQLVAYLVSNKLLPKFQSGFRRGHSTETAILRMLSDIYAAIDRGKVALLALLDVSAAFDTVDHDILLERLLVSFGVTGSAHEWLRSFLTSRSQSVRLGTSTSPCSPIRCGLPQGSILGPLLYILYTADIEQIVASHGLAVQLYADDTQIYGNGLPSDAEDLAARILAAISSVEAWMASNRLRLNAGKTQFIWFGTRVQLARRDLTALASISPSLVSGDPVRNLGVLLDGELTMGAHIKNLCRSCFFQLRRLRLVRHCLSRKCMLMLVHAFVCNRVDYCNGSLCGVSAGRLDRLQSVLNAAARLILNIPKHAHITSAIRDELHWLPVQYRSRYKLCLLVRSCVAGLAPDYLCELCIPVATVSGRQHLRSALRNDLVVPQFRTMNYGLRGFSVLGPRIWNSLPHDIRQSIDNLAVFKTKLKTHFFQLQQ